MFRALMVAAVMLAPVAAHGAEKRMARGDMSEAADGIPQQLDADARDSYRRIFAAIRDQRWNDAQILLNSMPPGPLHAAATAELYLAANSPRVELPQLVALLSTAPELPQADQLARLARSRGGDLLPAIPEAKRLMWHDAPPVRVRTDSISSDSAAARIATQFGPYVDADDGQGAEALVARYLDQLTPDARTEWQQRVAWLYYLAGDDGNARRLAARAQQGSGQWAAQADWVQGLASWRQKDCRTAQSAFQGVAERATDVELRSAGLYWASRADIACGRPDLVERRLQSAAQYDETFYGLLARQALGLRERDADESRFVAADWKLLEHRPNVRVAAALAEIGEDGLAEEVLRHQARIGAPEEHGALTRLAGRLNMPQVQLWLTHYAPRGAFPVSDARYPAPDWTPDGGWRVDKALLYAHALQESRFDAGVTSPAGAYGLMQIMPAAAADVGRRRGVTIARSDLTRPSTNMEVGQSYLEQLRDMQVTGGLLPKVIAAYNAGPAPLATWNAELSQDESDPLLFIESIPYWETRGYVMTVLRNYWVYERKDGRASASRSALSQREWPKFPDMQAAKGLTADAGMLSGGLSGSNAR